MSDERGNFSELDRARALSHQLADDPWKSAEPAPAQSASRYTRFRAGAVTTDTIQEPEPSFGPDAWNRVLDRCLSMAAAEAAFVMGSTGLLVAARGDGSASDAERLGAHLMATMAQARRIEHGGAWAGTVSVEIGGRWLTGLRIVEAGEGTLTVGVLAARPLGPDQLTQIARMVSAIGAG